jgi:hypothetical protein
MKSLNRRKRRLENNKKLSHKTGKINTNGNGPTSKMPRKTPLTTHPNSKKTKLTNPRLRIWITIISPLPPTKTPHKKRIINKTKDPTVTTITHQPKTTRDKSQMSSMKMMIGTMTKG